jgi:importin subunit beta-1
MALSADTRQKIKESSLITLASPQPRAGAVAAQVVSAIAAVELPVNQWADLVEILLGFINTSDDTNLKIATLQAIGYICETIVRGSLVPLSSSILIYRNRNQKCWL